MSKIRYYTDEHVAKTVIYGLRQRGVDVLTVPEANMLGADDEGHLAFALIEGRVVFTQDDDFLRLASSGKTGSLVFQVERKHNKNKILLKYFIFQWHESRVLALWYFKWKESI